jgi:hypothetical protein
MPPSQRLPLSLRYLKARLRILKRPKVWGSTAGLALVLLFAADYWLHPERYESIQQNRSTARGEGQTGVDAPLSPEGRAIGVELDSLPVLLNEMQQQGDSTQPDLNPFSSPTDTADRLLLPSPPAVSDPTARDALNLLSPQSTAPSQSEPAAPGLVQSNSGSPLLGGEPSTTALPPNPLRSALEQQRTAPVPPNRSLDTASSGQGTSPQATVPTAPLPTAPLPYLPQPVPGQSLNSVQPASRYLPQTAPPPGTTGYTLPPSLVPPAPATGSAYPNPVSPQSVQGLPAPVSGQPPSLGQPAYPNGYRAPQFTYPTQPNMQPQPIQPQPVPFSVPRSAPGQAIGNGEINTFSNP